MGAAVGVYAVRVGAVNGGANAHVVDPDVGAAVWNNVLYDVREYPGEGAAVCVKSKIRELELRYAIICTFITMNVDTQAWELELVLFRIRLVAGSSKGTPSSFDGQVLLAIERLQSTSYRVFFLTVMHSSAALTTG